MPTHIQDIAKAMRSPSFYPHDVERIRVEETHISMVFLTGQWVYKIKKPVRMGFLDFSTLASRKRFCRQEVSLNRRLAADVYEAVVPICFENGDVRLGGDGRIVEYAVKMRQLPAAQTMKRLLREGRISDTDIDRLARRLVLFYEQSETGGKIDAMGALPMIEKDCEDNFRQTAAAAPTVIDARDLEAIHQATGCFFKQHPGLFAHRVRSGNIRNAHGDLRTGHIYFSDDGIRIIDCIEFNEQFRYVDTICDLAFLTMDIDFLGFPEIARTLIRRYMGFSQDYGSFHLLSFYQCYRAMVRVKVNCLRLEQPGLSKQDRQELIEQTSNYMALAKTYSDIFSRPVLWVVCGLIATGKSTMANALSTALDLPVFGSDQQRKHLVADDGPAPYGKGTYTPEITDAVYDKLLQRAGDTLGKGTSVILDATFGSRHKRAAARQLAEDLNSRILFVECTCDEHLIRKRLAKRDREENPQSDARLEHLEPIKAAYQCLNEIEPANRIVIDTDKPADDALCRILSRFA